MDSVEALRKIFAALGAALAAAPNHERYAVRFPDAFRNLRYGDAAQILRELLDEVIEAADARRDSA